MPNHLEHVVRPSESPRIRPGSPSQIFATPKVVQNTPKQWGRAGDSVFDLRAHNQVELPQPKFEDERTFDTVRVYNPDDRSQFVDTEQMTAYSGRNKMSNDRIQLRFAPTKNTENTEVIQKGQIRKSEIPNN
jgi:hypothetical protein